MAYFRKYYNSVFFALILLLQLFFMDWTYAKKQTHSPEKDEKLALEKSYKILRTIECDHHPSKVYNDIQFKHEAPGFRKIEDTDFLSELITNIKNSDTNIILRLNSVKTLGVLSILISEPDSGISYSNFTDFSDEKSFVINSHELLEIIRILLEVASTDVPKGLMNGTDELYLRQKSFNQADILNYKLDYHKLVKLSSQDFEIKSKIDSIKFLLSKIASTKPELGKRIEYQDFAKKMLSIINLEPQIQVTAETPIILDSSLKNKNSKEPIIILGPNEILRRLQNQNVEIILNGFDSLEKTLGNTTELSLISEVVRLSKDYSLSYQVRSKAIEVLGSYLHSGIDDKDKILFTQLESTILESLDKDPNIYVRSMAVWSLSQFTPTNLHETVKSLKKALTSSDNGWESYSLIKRSKIALNARAGLLNSEPIEDMSTLKRIITWPLRKLSKGLGLGKIKPIVEANSKDPYFSIRMNILSLLVQFIHQSSSDDSQHNKSATALAKDTLIHTLFEDNNPNIRSMTASFLSRIESHDPNFLNELIKSAQGLTRSGHTEIPSNSRVKSHAILALVGGVFRHGFFPNHFPSNDDSILPFNLLNIQNIEKDLRILPLLFKTLERSNFSLLTKESVAHTVTSVAFLIKNFDSLSSSINPLPPSLLKIIQGESSYRDPNLLEVLERLIQTAEGPINENDLTDWPSNINAENNAFEIKMACIQSVVIVLNALKPHFHEIKPTLLKSLSFKLERALLPTFALYNSPYKSELITPKLLNYYIHFEGRELEYFLKQSPNELNPLYGCDKPEQFSSYYANDKCAAIRLLHEINRVLALRP